MKRFTTRTGGTFAAMAAALAVLGATVALAGSTPKAGTHYQIKNTGNGGQVTVISLAVDEAANITAASGSAPKCPASGGIYSGFVLDKSIDASNGKFSYKGKADDLANGSKVKVKLKGKFTSPKKSKGSYKLEGCKGKTKFQTQWTLGG